MAKRGLRPALVDSAVSEVGKQKNPGELSGKKSAEGGEIVPQLWTEFTKDTTLHGLKNVIGSKYRLRWVVWTAALLGMCLALCTSMFDLFAEYNSYPVLTRINIGITEELAFPAVTVCNLNPVDKTKVNFSRLGEYYQAFTPLRELRPINWSDPNYAELLQPVSKERFEHISPKSILKLCIWEGRAFSCRKNFTSRLTDMGICFTFNDAGQADKYGAVKTRHTGSMTGLILYFRIIQEDYVFNEAMSAGAKILLHNPYEEPDVRKQGFLVSPGFSSHVNIKQITYKFLPFPYKAFREVYCVDTDSPDFRQTLKYHRKYSYSACMKECRLAYIYKHCECRAFTDPGNGTVCSEKDVLECRTPMYDQFDRDVRVQRQCNCCHPCTAVAYESQLSFAYYPSDLVVDLLTQTGAGLADPRKDFFEVRLFYESLLYQEIVQIPQYTLLSILGTLGGQMGLFLGASILTLSEVAEFITMTAIVSFKKWFGKS